MVFLENDVDQAENYKRYPLKKEFKIFKLQIYKYKLTI